MTWNYRVIEDKDGSLGLYEVYYNDNEKIEGWTADRIIGQFENMDDLKTTLENMLYDVNKCIEYDSTILLEELEKSVKD